MAFPKLAAIAGGVAICSSLSFGWSISGAVYSKQGQPLSGVKISAFNFASITAETAENGTFNISDGTSAIKGSIASSNQVFLNGNVLTINNLNAKTVKVYAINALGKITYQRTLNNVFGSANFDLSKNQGKSIKFIRISVDNSNASFIVGGKGILLKEGDLLPMFLFTKDGFQNTNYQMTKEIETDVRVTMEESSNTQISSAVIEIKSSDDKVVQASSSSQAPASSSTKEEVVDCSGKTYAAGNHDMSVNVGGKQRTFIMRVPSAYKGDKPVPLLIDYHPIGGASSSHMNTSSYKDYTDPEGVISLYPQGTTKTMGPGWNVGPCCSNDDDLAFTTEMIKFAEEKLCIDKKRIYAAGFSMGGGMSNHVACMMNDVFAAVAPAAMDLNKTNSVQCKKTRPISVIEFRGTSDPVCRYTGGDSGMNDGLNFLGAEGNFKFWADFDECSGSPTKNSDGCQEYSNCKDGTKVVLCTDYKGKTGHDYGDGQTGWKFLKQFTLP